MITQVYWRSVPLRSLMIVGSAFATMFTLSSAVNAPARIATSESMTSRWVIPSGREPSGSEERAEDVNVSVIAARFPFPKNR